jgi:pilus assembly protein CpaD
MEPLPQNHVEFVTIEHMVAFAPSAIRPGDAELGRLLDFIDSSDVNSLDEILLDAPRRADGTHDAVTAARLEVIEGELLQLGLPVITADSPMAETKGGENQIAVVVERAVAVPPDCSSPQPGIGQRPDWNVGCANTAILGHMVADPRDLTKGRTLDPADGEMAAKAVENYRNPESEEGQSGDLIFELTTGGEGE